jgi:hypothetical protein
MATVLESVLPKSSVILCIFGAKGLNVNDIHKEIFPVYESWIHHYQHE